MHAEADREQSQADDSQDNASRARPMTARTNGTKAGLLPPGAQHADQLIIGRRGEAGMRVVSEPG